MELSRTKHSKLARQNFKLLCTGLKSETLQDTEYQNERAPFRPYACLSSVGMARPGPSIIRVPFFSLDLVIATSVSQSAERFISETDNQ